MSDFPDYQVGSRRLTVPSESVEGILVSETDTVASGDVEVVYVRPPSGYLYEMLGIDVEVFEPDGATSGFHNFYGETEKRDVRFMFGSAFYDTPLVFGTGVWVSADRGQRPPTPAGQTFLERGIRASEDNGFMFRYKNETDVDQTNEREYEISVRKIRVM